MYHRGQVQELLLLSGAHGMFCTVKESLTGLRLKAVHVHEIPTQTGIRERLRYATYLEARYYRVNLVINDQYIGNMEQLRY